MGTKWVNIYGEYRALINIREHSSILYLGMAMEILNLKFTTDLCISRILLSANCQQWCLWLSVMCQVSNTTLFWDQGWHCACTVYMQAHVLWILVCNYLWWKSFWNLCTIASEQLELQGLCYTLTFPGLSAHKRCHNCNSPFERYRKFVLSLEVRSLIVRSSATLPRVLSGFFRKWQRSPRKYTFANSRHPVCNIVTLYYFLCSIIDTRQLSLACRWHKTSVKPIRLTSLCCCSY